MSSGGLERERGRKRERGRTVEFDKAETERGGEKEVTDLLLWDSGYSVLLAAITGLCAQNGSSVVKNAQLGTERRRVAVRRGSVCCSAGRKSWTNCERWREQRDSWRFCVASSSKTAGLSDLGTER